MVRCILVVQSLINKSLETPNDPYINIDDALWPPYVEMLLRSGIIVRHPTNLYRIRLTAFHH